MNLKTAAALLAFSIPVAALAQDSHTGVSTPPPDTAPADAKPSAGVAFDMPPGYQPTPVAPATVRRELTPSSAPVSVPAGSAAGDTETYQPYRPATQRVADQPLAGTPVPGADGLIVGDSRVVGSESTGGLLRVRVRETLSTAVNHPGDPFTATVMEPIYQDHRVLVPAGSTLEGRLTEVRGGHRIHGAAALHLEPRRIVLPDGTHYDLHAQLIDSSQAFATRIDSEGTLYRRDHIKETVTAIGVGAGTGAVAGAVFGGGVGAGVGALVGAGVGTAWWLKQDRQTVLPKDTNLVFNLNAPLVIAYNGR